MKIWQKLVLVLGGSSLLLGTVSILTIKIDAEIQSQTEEVLQGMIRENQAAGDIFSSIQSIQDLNTKILLERQANSQESLKIQEYQRQIEFALNRLEKNIIAAREATNNQKEIIKNLPINHLTKKEKIEDEEEEIENLENLLEIVKFYRQEWNTYLEFGLQKQDRSIFYLTTSNKTLEESIFPLVKNYYEDTIKEIVESQLQNQKLIKQNIATIKVYTLFTFGVSLILFVYLYDSIYPAIKELKVATFELGLNFLEYRPIQPRNPHDELGDLTRYFNQTIAQLQEKITSKSYLDSIINSIVQNIIVMDSKNTIEKINYNTVELLGYSESELIGKPIDFIFSKNNNLEIEELIKLDEISQRCLAIELITKENTKVAVKAYFSDLLDSEGAKKGTICLAIESDVIALENDVLETTKIRAKKQRALN
ncbi:MAG: PAS domain-containing protein [Prochloraceae cyanobacterium]|nr:PAS domain-containing protein [Prochloraceae cyanobacterium]